MQQVWSTVLDLTVLRNLEATTELSAHAHVDATNPATPLGSSEEGGVAPIVHEMLRHVVNEMHRYERVISHWPLFGPYLEAALCVVLRSVIGAVSRQCGMTCIRHGHGPAVDIMVNAGAVNHKGSPRQHHTRGVNGSPHKFANSPKEQGMQRCALSMHQG